MKTDDELRNLWASTGVMAASDHPEVRFDWETWRERVAAEERPQRKWTSSAMVASLLLLLLVLPVLSRLSVARALGPETPYDMGRMIGLRLGDPYVKDLTWKRTQDGWIIQGKSPNVALSSSSRAQKKGQSYAQFRAQVARTGTKVTLFDDPFRQVSWAPVVVHVSLGPAPNFPGGFSRGTSGDSESGPLAKWATNIALDTGHREARATATLTTLADTHIQMGLTQWLYGPEPAILLSLRQGRWKQEYVISQGGADSVKSSLRVKGYHWSWRVESPTIPVDLSSAAKARILQWGQRFWGNAVTGYRYAAVKRLWTPMNHLSSSIEVQYLSRYGAMRGPIFFSRSGKEIYWGINFVFSKKPLGTAMVQGNYATEALAEGSLPITRLPEHYLYGHFPQPTLKRPTPRVLVSSSVHLASPFLTLAKQDVEVPFKRFAAGPFRSLTIQRATLSSGTKGRTSVRMRVSLSPAAFSQWRGLWTVRLTFKKVDGHWHLMTPQSPEAISGQFRP